jgi:L-iditol 2-dehydrogenase
VIGRTTNPLVAFCRLPAMGTTATPPQMKVAVTAPGGSLRSEERATPRPGPGEIVLRVRCSGLCGTDLWKLQHALSPPGSVLGHEVVGEVALLGAGVVGFVPGDRVVAMHHVACGRCVLCRSGADTQCPAFFENQLAPGGFSEYLLVGERGVERALYGLPPQIGDEAAVFLEPAACVVRGIRRAELPRDGTVSIVGAGAMGLLHLILLQVLSPGLHVHVSEPHAERAALARRLGASAVSSSPTDAHRDIDRLSRGRGAVAVFDAAGGQAGLDAAFDLGGPGSTVIVFAHADHGSVAALPINTLFKEERRLIGTYSSGITDQQLAYRLLVHGRLDPTPLVTHRLPLERCSEAVALAQSGHALKIVFTSEAA